MKKAFKKITAYSLLFITALPLILNVCLIISQTIIQHKMCEELERANLVTITTNASKLEWIRVGNEAIISGHLFDVKKYRLLDDKVILTGLFDKDEDKLIAQLKNLNRHDVPGGTVACSFVFQLMSCFLQCQHEINPINSFSFINKPDYSAWKDQIIINANLLNDTPPPKSIFS